MISFKSIAPKVAVLPIIALAALLLYRTVDVHFDRHISRAETTDRLARSVSLEATRLLLAETRLLTQVEKGQVDAGGDQPQRMKILLEQLPVRGRSGAMVELVTALRAAAEPRERAFEASLQTARDIFATRSDLAWIYRRSDQAAVRIVQDLDDLATRLIMQGKYLSEVRIAYRHRVKELISYTSAAMLNINDLLSFSQEEYYLETEKELNRRIDLTMNICANLAAITGDPADIAAWRRTAAFQPKIRELRDRLYALWKKRQQETAQLQAADDRFNRAAMAVSELAREEMDQLSAREDRTKWIVILATSLGLIVSGFLLVRSIVRPLNRVTATIVRFSLGESEGADPPRPGRRDEIGRLEQSVKRMAEQNAAIVRWADRLAKGDYSVQVQPRSEKDRLSRALLAMTESLREYSRRADRRSGELEREVANRTRELRRAVEQLTARQADLERAEQTIQQAHDRIKTILDELDLDVYVRDLETYELLFVNRHMRELYKADPDGMTCHRFFRNRDSACPDCFKGKLFDDQGRPTEGITEEAKGESTGRWVRVHHRAIRWVDGRWVHLHTGMDISNLKQADEDRLKLEQQLRQTQKMEALGTMAGGIAHDFNNILTAIIGFAELARGDAERGRMDADRLTQIVDSAERARDLVTGILTFSRRTDSLLKPMDLNVEIRQTHKMLERIIPRMISIGLDLAEDLHPILGDAAQLSQVLMNLGSNARDAMPEGGRLVIQTENISLGGDQIFRPAGLAPGDYVLLSVSDNGSGMDPADLEHIFDPFFTNKEVGRGAGLGLAIVYGIVNNHGGQVVCQSQPGRGTTFRIYLPTANEPIAEERPNRIEAKVPGGAETILVVDDEKNVSLLMKEMLTMKGYRVFTAASGEEALEIYRDRGGEIDLVLLDVSMPGMGGHKCLEELLALDPDVRVIVSSGYALTGSLTDTLNLGTVGFVAKPFSGAGLQAAVRDALDK